jgi:hypothetical protein
MFANPSLAEWVMIALDFYICVILTIEYFWGRSDSDLKNEAKKKTKMRRERYQFESLNVDEHK